MANPNIDIWGSPESWINCKNFYFIGSGNPELKTAKPKTANFADNSGTLSKGNETGKTPLNQNIDLSICPCGQDPHYSALGSIAFFRNKQTIAGNKEPYLELVRDRPCNWCLFDATGVGLSNTDGHQRDRTNTQQRWKPNADLQNNWNGIITPFTYWQLKSILIKIQVGCITNYAGDDTPYFTWRSLHDWKENYSSQKIIDVRLVFCGVNSQIGTNISYTSSSSMDTGDFGGVAILDDLSDITDYAAFGTARATNFLLFGHKTYGNYYDTASTFYMTGYNMLNGTELKALSSSSTENGWCIWSETPYSAENYEKIMSMVACFGIPFTDKDKSTFPLNYIDEDLYLPIIDDDGITHGEYTHGQDNEDNDLYDADSIRDKSYDPDQPFDPNIYSNVTGFNYITQGATMTVRWVLDGDNVNKLLSDLWAINATIAQGGDYEYFDGKIKDEYLTTNPIDCIVSLLRFPFDIPHQLQPLQSYVKLGKSSGTAKGWTTVYIANQINFKGIDIFPRFGNSFLDYEPYTSYELYVPFCGTTKIRAADILGHTLNLVLLIDLITGSCTAYVKADQLVIETLTGSCGIQQQISGTDTATMNANIYNGILATKQAKAEYIGHTVAALSPSNWVNPIGYATKGTQVENNLKASTYAIEHQEAPVHSQGAASPLLSWVQEFDARLLIYYPEGDVIQSSIPPSLKAGPLAAFGHLKGFATAQPGVVNSFRVQGRAAFLSGDILAEAIPCTQSERTQIKSFFANGVYLPPIL